jgi:hypothetical protein
MGEIVGFVSKSELERLRLTQVSGMDHRVLARRGRRRLLCRGAIMQWPTGVASIA